jgi:hypothetical protein
VSASRLYPKVYKGKEESGGYIATNESRKSDASPHYRGRVYIEGVGWYWLSGWLREKRGGDLIAISAKEMTDADAKQYCAEKPAKNPRRREATTEPIEENSPTNDRDIPF